MRRSSEPCSLWGFLEGVEMAVELSNPLGTLGEEESCSLRIFLEGVEMAVESSSSFGRLADEDSVVGNGAKRLS